MTPTWKLVAVLAGICFASGLALSSVFDVTKEPIAYQMKLEVIRSLAAVLPDGADIDPDADFIEMQSEEGTPVKVFRSGPDDEVTGAAFQVVSPEGYGGNIYIMMGVLPDGSLGGIEILAHAETPGLGDPIGKDQEWKDSFRGRTLENTNFKVKKDGGDIDQFTGATISPRAVTGAVEKGLKWFVENRDEILDPDRGTS
jgi:electron transport complex protein RnfG